MMQLDLGLERAPQLRTPQSRLVGPVVDLAAYARSYFGIFGAHPARVALIAANTRNMLDSRFRTEEGACGLFAFICGAAPRFVSMMDMLRRDHASFLVEVDDIQQRAAMRAGRGDLAVEIKSLLERVSAHELLEQELLMDALERR